MSTMTVWSNGFVSTSCSVDSSAVKPSAKYQFVDGVVVHGAIDVPAGSVARCSTRAPVPSTSTIAPTNGAVDGRRGADRRAPERRDLDGLRRRPVPAPASNVTRAVSGSSVLLLITKSPAVPSAPVAGTPGQNHVVVSAGPVGTAGIHGCGARRRTSGATPGSVVARGDADADGGGDRDGEHRDAPDDHGAPSVGADLVARVRPRSSRRDRRRRRTGRRPIRRSRCGRRRAARRRARRRGRSASRRGSVAARSRAGTDSRLAASTVSTHSTPCTISHSERDDGWAKRSTPGPAVGDVERGRRAERRPRRDRRRRRP